MQWSDSGLLPGRMQEERMQEEQMQEEQMQVLRLVPPRRDSLRMTRLTLRMTWLMPQDDIGKEVGGFLEVRPQG